MIALALALGAMSCGLEEEATGVPPTIHVSGALAFSYTSTTAPQRTEAWLTLEGPDLFVKTNACPNARNATEAVGRASAFQDTAGKYTVTFQPQDFHEPGGENCKLKAFDHRLLSGISLELSIVADLRNCKPYCAATSATGLEACVTRCVRGGRSITATASLAAPELPPAMDPANPPPLEISADLTLNTLSGPTTLTRGFDLSVDVEAAAKSARITRETVAADSCAILEGCVLAAGERRLLRFDGVLMNLGDEDLELGNPSGSSFFEYSTCPSHQHYHMKEAMLYELVSRDTGVSTRTGEMKILGRKQAFCLMDIRRMLGREPGKYNCGYQGITAGWADVYGSSLDCQWIDITDVPAGNYILRLTVNPMGTLPEPNRTNNAAEVTVSIPAE